ncbi:hypothetical protein IAQ61_003331 [Plenodomus lingam]|uniref:Predicted protein n=1 Tax=Leptosphaeria maculans (strain JN3 / isolate v23.1.3 / race Av1-4-5-6-7-8) TaxID=985895 RepID=E5AE65_LEPMJ|nr:predicted protein [Plenodomus lingam JN3]KAH9875866.1 hypothetical protein IAQ61_003331 [Plenodomus lingam]CBY01504.1 predicted protein [Plenodomus lingam JN3]
MSRHNMKDGDITQLALDTREKIRLLRDNLDKISREFEEFIKTERSESPRRERSSSPLLRLKRRLTGSDSSSSKESLPSPSSWEDSRNDLKRRIRVLEDEQQDLDQVVADFFTRKNMALLHVSKVRPEDDGVFPPEPEKSQLANMRGRIQGMLKQL